MMCTTLRKLEETPHTTHHGSSALPFTSRAPNATDGY
jgi:hypothetical protein